MSEGQEIPTQDARSASSSSNPSEEHVAVTSLLIDRRRSNIWDHFERKLVDDVWKCICNHCHRILGGNPRHGTKHLHDHKNVCPSLVPADVRRQIATREGLKIPFNQDDGRNALSKMIIMHDYPLNMVEHIWFRNYSTTLQPMFRCPSRNTLKNDIFKIYDIEKKKVMDVVEKCDSRVAVTSDMWTATNQMKGYMAITAHFIDDTWTLQNKILSFAYVKCPHTSETICKVLTECLMDWSLDTKLSTVTLDNCSTNDLMIDTVRSKIHPNYMILSGKFLHMRCSAHILNLIVKDGLTVIKSGIDNIRNSVAFWTATPKRVQTFNEAAKQLKVACSKALCLDCPTRWNSTFLMLETALMYKDVFYRLSQRNRKYETLPSDTDWLFSAEICEKLRLFYNVSELFSGTRYPTSNLYFPNICQIRLALDAWVASPNEVITKMSKEMLKKFQKYWDDIHVLMGVAIVLDPRFKLEIIDYFFPRIYGQEASKHTEKIRNACYELFHEYKNKNTTFDDLNAENILSSPLCSSQELDDEMLGFEAFVKKQKRIESSTKNELEKYLEAPLVRMKKDFDILLWWKQVGDQYPILKVMARDLLAIPISTVASESAFSTSGRIIDPHRNRLHHNTIEALMCTQSWLGKGSNNFDLLLGDEDHCPHDEVPQINA